MLKISFLKLKGETRWDALRDLVTFAQFKKYEKQPWKSVTFSKVASLRFLILLPENLSAV